MGDLLQEPRSAAYCLHAAKTTPAQRVWLTCFGGAWAVLGAIRAVV